MPCPHRHTHIALYVLDNTSFQDLKLRIDNEKALAEAAKKQQDEVFTLQKELLLEQITNACQEGHNSSSFSLRRWSFHRKKMIARKSFSISKRVCINPNFETVNISTKSIPNVCNKASKYNLPGSAALFT